MTHLTNPDPSPTNLDHDLFTGEADGMRYLLWVYADGTYELATRALDAPRWSAPVILKRETL